MAMDAPRISGVMETSLYVSSLERSETFYRSLFGFEPFMRDERMASLAISPGQVLLLFLRGGSTAPSAGPDGGIIPAHDAEGQQHLCFGIPMQSLDAWEVRLRDAGIAIESRLTWPHGGTSLYFRDPDQHSLEVATSGLWPNT